MVRLVKPTVSCNRRNLYLQSPRSTRCQAENDLSCECGRKWESFHDQMQECKYCSGMSWRESPGEVGVYGEDKRCPGRRVRSLR
jgi:hypothetical protein